MLPKEENLKIHLTVNSHLLSYGGLRNVGRSDRHILQMCYVETKATLQEARTSYLCLPLSRLLFSALVFGQTSVLALSIIPAFAMFCVLLPLTQLHNLVLHPLQHLLPCCSLCLPLLSTAIWLYVTYRYRFWRVAHLFTGILCPHPSFKEPICPSRIAQPHGIAQ